MASFRFFKRKTREYQIATSLELAKTGDVICVNGHGSPYVDRIFLWENPRGRPDENLTSEQLAAKLLADGLNRDEEVRIKLQMCFAAVGAEEQTGFAFKFWWYLHEEVQNLTVYAYTRAVHSYAFAAPIPWKWQFSACLRTSKNKFFGNETVKATTSRIEIKPDRSIHRSLNFISPTEYELGEFEVARLKYEIAPPTSASTDSALVCDDDQS